MAKVLLLVPLLVPTRKIECLSNSFKPQFCVRCCNNNDEVNKKKKKRLSEQSSWEAKDGEGKDYLYRLGKEADNMNIAVGQRSGLIDDLFAGNFLGKDCNPLLLPLFSLSYSYAYIHTHVIICIFSCSADIVFDYRQKVTRSFQYLQGDYYIAPLFMVTNFPYTTTTTIILLVSDILFFSFSSLSFHRTKLVISLKIAHSEQRVVQHAFTISTIPGFPFTYV